MTPERWRQVTALFHDALACAPTERAAFLARACADDGEVRSEVDRLLAAHERAGRFGEDRVATLGAEAPTIDVESSVAPRPPQAFIWIVWAATLVTCAAFVYAATVLVVDKGATKAIGWTEAPRAGGWFVARVDSVGPAAGQLVNGDRLISLNGVAPLRDGGTRVHRRKLSAGEAYRLAIERHGRRLEAALIVAEGSRDLRTPLIYYFVSLVWCAVGLFIGFARPEQPVARLAFGAAVGTGLVFLGGFMPSPFLLGPFHIVLGLHFFLLFPSGRAVTGIWKWILVFAYGVAAVPVALSWWFEAVLLSGGVPAVADLVARHQTLFALRGPTPVYLYYACLVGMVTAAAHNYHVISDEDERRRVRWVAYGSIVSFMPQVALSVAELTIGGAAANDWIGLPANAATAGIPLFVAYAVVKHRVFDIRFVVRRGVQYLLARRALQVAVALPAIALAYTVFSHRHLTLVALVTETSAYLYWLAAAGLMLRFRRTIESWLDRRFFREEYNKEQLLLGLLDEVRKVESMSELSRLASDRLASALHPSGIYVWYRARDELAAASSSEPLLTPADFPCGDGWLAWLEERGTATPTPRGPEAGLSRADVRWFDSHGISLIVPMMDQSDRLVGALLLGPKRSEAPYSASDRGLLDAIAKQAADVREILRLRARVSDEVRVRHDVLARLDGRLRDVLRECPDCGACFDGAVDRCEHDGQVLRLSLPVARTIDGKYRLNRLIGKGGMGAVYEAFDLRLERAVAVKIMLSRAFGEQTALRRFRREARAAAYLTHPNIVGVFDFGALEGEGAYLVMEMVRGRTLRSELERSTRLPPAIAAEWFAPLLDGTAAAHAHGIIHRDLKPENVIGRRDEAGSLTVKILDLGLVKFGPGTSLATSPMTSDGLVMGTPAYMSPEQLLGREVDQRTDIFALAVMLIESLTGRRPFEGDSLADLLFAQQQASYRLPASTARARAIADLLQRCLAVDPCNRISSAAALRADLIPLLQACQYDDIHA